MNLNLYKLFVAVCLYLSFISLVSSKKSDNNNYEDDEDDEGYEISCTSNFSKYMYYHGDPMVLCMNYLPFMIKSNIILKVGETAVIHQKDMWKVLKDFETDLVFQVADSKVYSSPIAYNRPLNNISSPFIPLLITVDYGTIIDIRVEDIEEICDTRVSHVKLLKDFYKKSI
jgi:hypothetical protein